MTTSTEMRGVADPDEPGREYRINWKPVLVPYLKSRGPPAGGLPGWWSDIRPRRTLP